MCIAGAKFKGSPGVECAVELFKETIIKVALIKRASSSSSERQSTAEDCSLEREFLAPLLSYRGLIEFALFLSLRARSFFFVLFLALSGPSFFFSSRR